MPIDSHTHVMVDIETYDTKPSAVILSIGADVILGSGEFYQELDISTQYERTASIATKEWWAKQGNPPIHGTVTLHDALTNFATFLAVLPSEPIIWCKGTDFDVAILTHAYQALYRSVPWKYNNVRDCRTVFKLAGINPPKASHNALEDAIMQSDYLCKALEKLGATLA